MFYYLYQITNTINNKIYVGVHKTENVNDNYMGSGKLIKLAIKKHGLENFNKTILEFFNSYEEALIKEEEIVNDMFLERDDVYNLVAGGKGGFDYINREKIPKMLGKTHTEETKEKIRMKNIGRTLTEEAKEKIRKRWENEEEHTNFGLIMSKALSGRALTETHKKNISKALSGKKSTKKSTNFGEKNGAFGTCYIYNIDLQKSIRIKKYDLDLYLENGWVKGRRIKW